MNNASDIDTASFAQKSSAPPPASIQPAHDPDEINLLEYFYVLVKNKWVLLAVMFVGLFGGYVAALIKGPSFVAEALIAPRESESQGSPNLSELGMFGGMVASQLNLGGNASLENVDLVLDSRKFNAEMIEKNELLPLIYAEFWDTATQSWVPDFIPPEPLKAAGYLKSEFLEKEINKNNTMSIKISNSDSVFAYTVLNSYLTHLDSYIKKSVQQEAKENRAHLETQLIGVTDPLLRAKVQELVANEMEKQMVVAKEAFRIIDPVYVSKQFKEKTIYPLVLAFGLFFLTTLLIVFSHALNSSDKTEEDQRYIEGIKRELFFFKKK